MIVSPHLKTVVVLKFLISVVNGYKGVSEFTKFSIFKDKNFYCFYTTCNLPITFILNHVQLPVLLLLPKFSPAVMLLFIKSSITKIKSNNAVDLVASSPGFKNY